jgi:hypothetical protein
VLAVHRGSDARIRSPAYAFLVQFFAYLEAVFVSGRTFSSKPALHDQGTAGEVI